MVNDSSPKRSMAQPFTPKWDTVLPALLTGIFLGLITLGIHSYWPSPTLTRSQTAIKTGWSPEKVAYTPVKWTQVEAQRQADGIALTWRVSRSAAFSAFMVERAIGEGAFQAIGRIEEVGEPTTNETFTFFDQDLPDQHDTLRYRIQATPKQGNPTFGPTLHIMPAREMVSLDLAIIHPPQSGFVEMAAYGAGEYRLEIMTSNGEVVEERQVSLKGHRQWHLNSSNWESGLYLLRISGQERRKTTGVWIR